MQKATAIQLADFFIQFQLQMIKKGRMNIATFAAKQCDKYLQQHINDLKKRGWRPHSKACHPLDRINIHENHIIIGFEKKEFKKRCEKCKLSFLDILKKKSLRQ